MVADPAPAVASARKVTTTVPETLPKAGSDFFVTVPPDPETATVLYPPGTVTLKVMSASFSTWTLVIDGDVIVGVSGTTSSSQATKAIAMEPKASIDSNFLMNLVLD
jgi:hypothetical protein